VSTPTAVIGAGSFGTCLAILAARAHDVKIWSRRDDVASAINRDRRNPRYLSDI
jgi:glycerol-3-phosphate dehydrogenase (NAD(P)+)